MQYVVTDTLGSVRAITDQYGEVVSRRDFMPFGEELEAGATYRKYNLKYNADNVRQKFTGYQKDEETGLDFAEARMYNNSHARFTAVDPLLASGKSANPQTFNRYVYVLNSPMQFVDPDGLQMATTPNAKESKRIKVPKRVIDAASKRTITGFIGPKSEEKPFTVTAPTSLVNFQRRLATNVYIRLGNISRQSYSNNVVGQEVNPTQGSITNSDKSSTSKTTQDSATTEGNLGASKDGVNVGVGRSSTSGKSNTVGNESADILSVLGPSTSVIGPVKSLTDDANVDIVNYLNTHENKDGNFIMKGKVGDSNKTVDIVFTRATMETHLRKFTDAVRNTATCDFNPNACPRMKPEN